MSAGNSDNRRRHPRHPLQLLVRLSSGDRTFELVSENVSLGGIFLLTQGAPLPLHETVQLEVVLPDATPAGSSVRIPIEGVVLYAIEDKGCGVEFLWWTDEERARRAELAAYLESLGLTAGDVEDALGAGGLAEASEVES